jgi:hypothetical protein
LPFLSGNSHQTVFQKDRGAPHPLHVPRGDPNSIRVVKGDPVTSAFVEIDCWRARSPSRHAVPPPTLRKNAEAILPELACHGQGLR